MYLLASPFICTFIRICFIQKMADYFYSEQVSELGCTQSDHATHHACYMMQVYSDLYVDYLKMFLLNVPATVVALGL